MPDEKPPVLPPTSTIAKDLAADAGGFARDLTPTPPPPGTIAASFLQNPGTQVAIATTIGFLFLFGDSLITGAPINRAEIAVAYKVVVWAWLAAVGIHKAGPETLRWK